MERGLPLWQRVKSQRYPRQHGDPQNVRHSEQPNEAPALVDQRLSEHGHADGAESDSCLYMPDEQKGRRVHQTPQLRVVDVSSQPRREAVFRSEDLAGHGQP